MHVFPMDLWNLSTGSQKILNENLEDSLILIIHAIAFSGLQETIQALEVFLNQKMKSKRIKEKNADHIIRKNKRHHQQVWVDINQIV